MSSVPKCAVSKRPSDTVRAATRLKRRSIGLANTVAKQSRLGGTRPAIPSTTSQPSSSSTLPRPSRVPLTGRSTLAGPLTSRDPSPRPAPSSRPTVTQRNPSPAPTRRPAIPKNPAVEIRELKQKVIDLEVRLERAVKKSESDDAKIRSLTTEVKEARGLRDELVEKDKKIVEQKMEILTLNDAFKEMHNAIVDLKGQIRVAVRVRSSLDKFLPETGHLSFPSSTTINLLQGKKEMKFEFNNVFGPNYSQSHVFEAVQELVQSALHGYNVSLIAYGQTGSGKTYTMRGGDGDTAGIIPRAVQYLFNSKHKLEELFWKFEFTASFCEVYNDECYDLLSTPGRKKCEVHSGAQRSTIHGMTNVPIDSKEKISSLLYLSDRHRSTASTKMNEYSSRSHAIFCLNIRGENTMTGSKVDSALKLVDLAGSERAKESGVEGERFQEMTQINGSLSNLQAVIRALMNKQKHVPYRNKLLTRLLQDSLGGTSKAMVIVTLNPELSNQNETKRSLDFARDMSTTNVGVAKKRETTD